MVDRINSDFLTLQLEEIKRELDSSIFEMVELLGDLKRLEEENASLRSALGEVMCYNACDTTEAKAAQAQAQNLLSGGSER
jgi:hypothetical protein